MAKRKDTQTRTRVVFRKWRTIDGGGIVACLLDVPANPGRVMMYEHVGQHGEGSYHGVIDATDRATPSEYAALKLELERIGYVLIVRTRRQYARATGV